MGQTAESRNYGDQKDEHSGITVNVTSKTKLFAFCAALNSCNLGYDVGVSSGVGMLLQSSMDLSVFQTELFMGSLNLFAMIGAMLSHIFADRYGRRGAFILAAAIFIIGVSIQSSALSFATLMIGRFLVGLGVGSGLAIDPVYIAEISPPEHRGRLVTWSEIATNVGILFGFLSGAIFINLSENLAWRCMFAMGAILPAIMIFLVLLVMPESPRWLVSKGREEKAKGVLSQLYPPGYNVDLVVHDIKESIKREVAANQSFGWDMIFRPSPAFRRMLVVGISAAVAQQLVGVDAVQYYLAFILEQAGIQSRGGQTTALCLLGVVKLIFIFVGGHFFDRKGRRPMFFISLVGCASSLLLLAISYFGGGNSALAIIGLCLYFAFFSLGIGPGSWLVPSEVFALAIRAKAMSVATFMNRAAATLMSTTFLSTANAIGYGGFFLLLAVCSILIVIFFYFFLPETKGRPLEEMSLYFAEITGDILVLEAEARLKERGTYTVEMSNSSRKNYGAAPSAESAADGHEIL